MSWRFSLLIVVVLGLVQSALSFTAMPLGNHFALTQGHIKLLDMAVFYIYMLAMLPAGMLLDKIGARKVLTFSLLITGAGLLLLAAASTYKMLLAGSALIGLGCAPGLIASLLLANAWRNDSHSYSFRIGLCFSLSLFAGTVLNEFLSRWYPLLSWRWLFGLSGKLCFCLALLTWLLVRDRPALTLSSQQKLTKVKTSRQHAFSELFTTPRLWLIAIISGLMYTPAISFSSLWFRAYAVTITSLPHTSIPLYTDLLFWGGVIGAPLLGYAADKMAVRKSILAISNCICIIGLIILINANHIPAWEFSGLLFLLGFFMGGFAINFSLIHEKIAQQHAGFGFAFANMLCLFISVYLFRESVHVILKVKGPMAQLSQTLLTHPNDFKTALLVLVGALSLALILTFFIKETHAVAENWQSD